MTVIDASVYVALINAQEAAHARTWSWFEETQLALEPLAAPVILLAETAAALSRGMGDAILAREAVEQLVRSRVIELLPVAAALARRAAIIAAEQRIRGCDAIYVALAEQLNDDLITLDRQQLERGAAVVVTRQP